MITRRLRYAVGTAMFVVALGGLIISTVVPSLPSDGTQVSERDLNVIRGSSGTNSVQTPNTNNCTEAETGTMPGFQNGDSCGPNPPVGPPNPCILCSSVGVGTITTTVTDMSGNVTPSAQVQACGNQQSGLCAEDDEGDMYCDNPVITGVCAFNYDPQAVIQTTGGGGGIGLH